MNNEDVIFRRRVSSFLVSKHFEAYNKMKNKSLEQKNKQEMNCWCDD